MWEAVVIKFQAANGLQTWMQYMAWWEALASRRSTSLQTYGHVHGGGGLRIRRQMEWKIGQNGLEVTPADGGLLFVVCPRGRVWGGALAFCEKPIKAGIDDYQVSVTCVSGRVDPEKELGKSSNRVGLVVPEEFDPWML